MKKFIYGLNAVKYEDMVLGYIETGSFDWGGQKGESVDVGAEQVPAAPVLTLVTKNGTISPTFNIIQLDYANLKACLGGSLVGSEEEPTGWKAPTNLIELRGKINIDTTSGKTVTIPNALLMSNLGGKLTLNEVSKLECQLKINAPEDGSAPYEINDTEEG